MNVGVAMLVLFVCYWMFRHYRNKVKCDYCGSEWKKHADHCPLQGSGQ